MGQNLRYKVLKKAGLWWWWNGIHTEFASWLVFQVQEVHSQKIGLLQGTWMREEMDLIRTPKKENYITAFYNIFPCVSRNEEAHIKIPKTKNNVDLLSKFTNKYNFQKMNTSSLKPTGMLRCWHLPIPLESSQTTDLQEEICMKFASHSICHTVSNWLRKWTRAHIEVSCVEAHSRGMVPLR